MASTSYDQALDNFKKQFTKFMQRLQGKINNLTVKTETFSSNILVLKNNTVHQYNGVNGISSLTITYPEGEFVSTILFSTAKSGSININFPQGTKFVGSTIPKFYAAENWEISIHNGRVACAQLYEEV